MKYFILLLLPLFFCLSAQAQIKTLPKLEEIDGVSKAIMNPRLYPLLLKVHVGEDNSTADFKKLVANLKHFEIYTANKETASNQLITEVENYKQAFGFNGIAKNTFEKETDAQKEFLVIKQKKDSSAVVYVFTTTKKFTGIAEMGLL